VPYQGRKKRSATNSLYLTDRHGLPLALSSPIAGNHNDLYEIEKYLREVFSTLIEAQISTEGLFVNADLVLIIKTFVQLVRNGELFQMLLSIIAMEKAKMSAYQIIYFTNNDMLLKEPMH